jgi:hypothetical protein
MLLSALPHIPRRSRAEVFHHTTGIDHARRKRNVAIFALPAEPIGRRH